MHAHAQDAGSVNLHSDPRLALLLSKVAKPEKVATKTVAPAKSNKPKPPKIIAAKDVPHKPDSSKATLKDKNVMAAPVASASKSIDVKNTLKPSAAKAETTDAAKPATDKEVKDKEHKDIVRTPRRAVLAQSHGPSYTGPGYRVQLYYGSDRARALKVKSDFMSHYPGVRTYLIFSSPNYKVKAGDFRNRNDAQEMYKEANAAYHPVMIVPDEITINPN